MTVGSTPLLSICIPTYNRAHKLARLLDGLIPQLLGKEREVEVCISDNASSDDTERVVSDYAQRFPVRYVRNPSNLGACLNMLNVYRMARGDYLWAIGDDDVFLPGAIDRIWSFLRADEFQPDMVNVQVLDEHDRCRYFTWVDTPARLDRDTYRKFVQRDGLDGVGFIGANIFQKRIIPEIDSDVSSILQHPRWPHLYLFVAAVQRVERAVLTDPLIRQIGDGLYWEPHDWLRICLQKVRLADSLVAQGKCDRRFGRRVVAKTLLGRKALRRILAACIIVPEQMEGYLNDVRQYRREVVQNNQGILALHQRLVATLAKSRLPQVYSLYCRFAKEDIRETHRQRKERPDCEDGSRR